MALDPNAVYPVTADEDYPSAVAGTLDSLKGQLLLEAQRSGYSLTGGEVLSCLVKATQLYAAHATLQIQRRQAEGSTTAIPIDGDMELDLFEWSIIQPLAKAYVEQIQAARMEAAASLNMERFGMSVGEANQRVTELEMALPRAAFVESPFSIELE